MIGRRGAPRPSCAGFLAFCWLFSCATALSQEVTIWPQSVVIDGPRGSQQLVAQAKIPDGHEEDLTRRAVFSSSDPAILEFDVYNMGTKIARAAAMETVVVAERSAGVQED